MNAVPCCRGLGTPSLETTTCPRRIMTTAVSMTKKGGASAWYSHRVLAPLSPLRRRAARRRSMSVTRTHDTAFRRDQAKCSLHGRPDY
jgi:hypothetical protein